MQVILDLDYTLLDTERFKEALASVFAAAGISKERFLTSYKKIAERNMPAYDYDLEFHLDLLQSELNCSTSEVRSGVQKVLQQTNQYLYPGTEEFLRTLQTFGCNLILLSLGNKEWQAEKIQRTGLVKYFSDIILVAHDKAEALAQMSDLVDPVIIVNDNCHEVQAMQLACPQYHYIVKLGPKGCQEQLQVPKCEGYAQVLRQIEQIIS